MGTLAALLFTRLQRAEFYRAMTQDAVALLPAGAGRTLLDIGCGPGLLARLAANRGYRALGIDSDPRMIAAACRLATAEHSTATFLRGELRDLPLEAADVVAAASLLAVVPDPRCALSALWRSVAPGGRLLIAEPTAGMTTDRARHLIATRDLGRGAQMLMRWAAARQGRVVDMSDANGLVGVAEERFVPLLHGLVGAWLLEKAAPLPGAPSSSLTSANGVTQGVPSATR